MFAEAALSRLESIHSIGIVHRDLKPSNFMIGSDDKIGKIYLIDFGLSNYFRKKNGEHIEFKSNVGHVGNLRFSSINAL